MVVIVVIIIDLIAFLSSSIFPFSHLITIIITSVIRERRAEKRVTKAVRRYIKKEEKVAFIRAARITRPPRSLITYRLISRRNSQRSVSFPFHFSTTQRRKNRRGVPRPLYLGHRRNTIEHCPTRSSLSLILAGQIRQSAKGARCVRARIDRFNCCANLRTPP